MGRLIGILVGIAFIGLAFYGAFRLLLWMGRIIKVVLTTVVVIFIALCIPAVAVGMASPGNESMAALLGIAMSVVFVVLFWRLWSGHGQADQRKAGDAYGWQGKAVASRVQEPDSDRDIAAAWKIAVTLAPTRASELNDARECCAALLRASDSDPFDTALLDIAIKIRRNVPEFVSLCEQGLSHATADQKGPIRADLILSLTALGRQSRTALQFIHERQHEKREVLSRHLQSD